MSQLSELKGKLTGVRDRVMTYISHVEASLTPEQLEPPPATYWYQSPVADVWSLLRANVQLYADSLRSEIRSILVDIAELARHSVLIEDADLLALAKNAKRMAAAIRFKQYKSWGVQIHHDEGTYIGKDPAGQSESDSILPKQARDEFLTAYAETLETTDLLSSSGNPQSSSSGPHSIKAQRLTYTPGTAFIMMWIDPSHPELNDVRDVVAEVFKSFGVAF